jgi:putative transposase
MARECRSPVPRRVRAEPERRVAECPSPGRSARSVSRGFGVSLRVIGGPPDDGWEQTQAVFAGADRGEAARGGEAVGAGVHDPAVCKRLGITDQMFHRWRLKFGAMSGAEAARLKMLQQEDTRLKEDRREPGVGLPDVEGLAAGKLVCPSRRRQAVVFLQRRHRVSERRAWDTSNRHKGRDRDKRTAHGADRSSVEIMARGPNVCNYVAVGLVSLIRLWSANPD